MSRWVQLLTNLNPRVGPLPKNLKPEAPDALKLAEARVSRVLEILGSHLYVFYVSWRLGEAHLYVFYVSRRFRGGPASNQPTPSYAAGWVPFLRT